MMQEIVYINGKLVEKAKAHLSVADHGLLYSFGLFQTMRAYNGKLFLLEKHIQRLHEAARLIGMEDKLKGIDFAKICNDTLAANKLKSARVRLTVTNGANEAMPWIDPSGPPTVIVTARPFTTVPEEKYRQGYKLGIAALRRMKQSPLSTIKSTAYLLNVVARMEGTQQGYDEVIMLNERGIIAEAGGGNLFFVKGGKLLTPAVDNGLIPGVTRETVLALAKGMGIKAIEGDIRSKDIKGFDEIFLTNAIIEVMPVTKVEDIVIGDGKPGEITQRLMQAYRETVKKETLNTNT